MNTNSAKKKHVLQWHIIHRCNLRCTHCYQDEYISERSFTDLEKLFYQYMDFCEKYNFRGHINFTGGEPLLSEYLFPLLELCDKNKITYGILTNGTLIDSTVSERLKNQKNLSFVQVSIDGTEKVHDSIRGKGSFSKMIRGTELLRRSGIQTMAAFTCHKGNKNELEKVIRLVRKNKIDRFWADRLIPESSNSEEILSTEEYRKIIKLLTKEHGKKRLFSKTDVHINRSLQFLEGGDCFYRCSAGTSLLTLLADGTLLPCRRLPLSLGNCFEHDMISLYENSDIIKDLKKDSIPDECMACPKADWCRGGAKCLSYALTGDYKLKDVNCYYVY